MKRFQVELDEWSSVVWVRRITDAMSEKDAISFCRLMERSGLVQVRNVAIRELVHDS